MVCPRSAPIASSRNRRLGTAALLHVVVGLPIFRWLMPRRPQDRGIVGVDCAVGVLHGNTVSLGVAAARPALVP
jgi:hypothetical protein